jgi:hypothetical protein
MRGSRRAATTHFEHVLDRDAARMQRLRGPRDRVMPQPRGARRSLTQPHRHAAEAIERGFQALDDLSGEHEGDVSEEAASSQTAPRYSSERRARHGR